MAPDPLPFITHAPSGVAGWAACFDPTVLPVLAETAESLEALRSIEDAVDARLLAETIAADPLMTLKLMAHVAGLRRAGGAERHGDAETVTAALVMLGIGPFFRLFGRQQTVEEVLDGLPDALAGFRAVLKRSHRAANFAAAFAARRMDHDLAVIHEAALLHDFAELLLWLRAPRLAGAIADAQQKTPALRSSQAQMDVLHVELPDLQQAMMTAWRLPELLVRVSDDRHADSPQVRNVLLAIRVARHSAQGWDNPALPDDVAAVADLLQLGLEPARRLLHDIDA